MISLIAKIIVGSSCVAAGATATTLGIVYKEKVAEWFADTPEQEGDVGANTGTGSDKTNTAPTETSPIENVDKASPTQTTVQHSDPIVLTDEVDLLIAKLVEGQDVAGQSLSLPQQTSDSVCSTTPKNQSEGVNKSLNTKIRQEEVVEPKVQSTGCLVDVQTVEMKEKDHATVETTTTEASVTENKAS